MPEGKALVSPEHRQIRGTGVCGFSVYGSPLHSLPLLLTQKLEDGWEVLVSVASGAHDSVDLVGEGTQRDGRLSVGGSVLSQTKILWTQVTSQGQIGRQTQWSLFVYLM